MDRRFAEQMQRYGKLTMPQTFDKLDEGRIAGLKEAAEMLEAKSKANNELGNTIRARHTRQDAEDIRARIASLSPRPTQD